MHFYLECCTKISVVLLGTILACASEELIKNNPASKSIAIVSEVDSAVFNLGIPLYTSDQGKEFWSEFNSELRPFRTEEARSLFYRRFHQGNAYLECLSDGGEGNFGVRISLFKTVFDQKPLPETVAKRVTGLRFNAVGSARQIITVKVLDVSGQNLVEKTFQLEPMRMKSYSLDFESSGAKEVTFFTSSGESDSTWFGLDDVYLKTDDAERFYPPSSDADFLAWLKKSSYNFFDWNYVPITPNKGVVLESSTSDIVSLSGIGYAYPIFIIAAQEEYISADEAKSRIKAMLQWQVDQNWFDGTSGWHGFPNHYFKSDGSFYQSDVSTIDWAICAAGIRTVKQHYKDDSEIVLLADELLARPDWSVALANANKIVMGFDKRDGQRNDYRWGLAFSEETELVYLEAVASGDLSSNIFEGIFREKKNGFYPSWFGAGFTYNWLQLWTGPIEPYKSNATAAFDVDATTSLSAFGRPLMGLTACATVKDFRANGFQSWQRYISNQGGSVHGAGLGEVIQISPAPYGAALALPFNFNKAITALREFTKMGYYHEYLGLPDNVRLKELPNGISSSPNWDSFDINIGPIILAIEQIERNGIAKLYLADPAVMTSLNDLKKSF